MYLLRKLFCTGIILALLLQTWLDDSPSLILSSCSTISTLLIQAVCRTRVKYEPSIWPRSPWVRRNSEGRAPARCLGGKRFESCRRLGFFLSPTLVICWLFHFHKLKIVEIWFVGGQKSLFRGQKIAGESQTDFLPVLFISQDVCVLFCFRRSPVHVVVEMEH